MFVRSFKGVAKKKSIDTGFYNCLICLLPKTSRFLPFFFWLFISTPSFYPFTSHFNHTKPQMHKSIHHKTELEKFKFVYFILHFTSIFEFFLDWKNSSLKRKIEQKNLWKIAWSLQQNWKRSQKFIFFTQMHINFTKPISKSLY